MEREIVEEGVRDVTHRLWHESLGFEPCSTGERTVPCGCDEEVCGARIDIGGAWEGAVAVEMSGCLACNVARRMFDLGAEVPTSEQVDDCVREIANITAGNLKTALPEPCVLSVPQTTHPGSWRSGLAESAVEPLVLGFECDGQFFRVVVVKRSIS